MRLIRELLLMIAVCMALPAFAKGGGIRGGNGGFGVAFDDGWIESLDLSSAKASRDGLLDASDVAAARGLPRQMFWLKLGTQAEVEGYLAIVAQRMAQVSELKFDGLSAYWSPIPELPGWKIVLSMKGAIEWPRRRGEFVDREKCGCELVPLISVDDVAKTASVDVNRFMRLPAIDMAALMVHERLFWLFRKWESNFDGEMTRKVVRMLFSKKFDPREVAKALPRERKAVGGDQVDAARLQGTKGFEIRVKPGAALKAASVILTYGVVPEISCTLYSLEGKLLSEMPGLREQQRAQASYDYHSVMGAVQAQAEMVERLEGVSIERGFRLSCASTTRLDLGVRARYPFRFSLVKDGNIVSRLTISAEHPGFMEWVIEAR